MFASGIIFYIKISVLKFFLRYSNDTVTNLNIYGENFIALVNCITFTKEKK